MFKIVIIFIILQQIISYYILAKKFNDYLNFILVTFIFIYFPFCLSELNLSIYQIEAYNPITYLMMFSSSNFIMIGCILIKSNKEKNLNFKIKFRKIYKLIILMDILFMVSYFYENLVISGVYIPILSIGEIGDNHLLGVKYVREFNSMCRLLLPIFNYYIYDVTKKKKYILFAVITLAIPLSRGSRIAFLNGIIMILLYAIKKINFKKIIAIAMICIAIVFCALNVGKVRISNTKTTYAQKVGIFEEKYSENLFGELVSWYYGYYSLAFYNFNLSMNNWIENPKRYYGLTNLNGLLSYFIKEYPTQEEFNSRLVYINGAANVPTALYFYIMDFGIVGAILFEYAYYYILFILYKKSRNCQFYRVIYCCYIANILFFVFYSSFYSINIYPSIIFIIIFGKICIKKIGINTSKLQIKKIEKINGNFMY